MLPSHTCWKISSSFHGQTNICRTDAGQLCSTYNTFDTQMLDGVPLRAFGSKPMTVSVAKFEMKGDTYQAKKKSTKNARKVCLLTSKVVLLLTHTRCVRLGRMKSHTNVGRDLSVRDRQSVDEVGEVMAQAVCKCVNVWRRGRKGIECIC